MPGGDRPRRPGLRINSDNHPDRCRIGNGGNIGGAGAGQPVGVRMVVADNRPTFLPRTAVRPQKVWDGNLKPVRGCRAVYHRYGLHTAIKSRQQQAAAFRREGSLRLLTQGLLFFRPQDQTLTSGDPVSPTERHSSDPTVPLACRMRRLPLRMPLLRRSLQADPPKNTPGSEVNDMQAGAGAFQHRHRQDGAGCLHIDNFSPIRRIKGD